MDGAVADVGLFDPPYNVRIDGHAGGLGRTRHREFAEASGEMSSVAFTGFLTQCLSNAAAVTREGAISFVFMDWRHMAEMLAAGLDVYSQLKNLIVWVKDNGGMGSFYRSRHELVFVFKSGNAAHMNNFGLGEHGRYRTNVWEYRGVNTFSKDRNSELAMHPTVKPVSMIADAIMDVSGRGDIVLDAFGGSGSTLIAAHRTGRRARLLELDPGHVDTTIRRFEAWARDDAIHADTGRTFTEVMAARAVNANGHPDDAAQMPDDSLRPVNDTTDRNAVRKGGSDDRH
jgi:DNA modification methylase